MSESSLECIEYSLTLLKISLRQWKFNFSTKFPAKLKMYLPGITVIYAPLNRTLGHHNFEQIQLFTTNWKHERIFLLKLKCHFVLSGRWLELRQNIFQAEMIITVFLFYSWLIYQPIYLNQSINDLRICMCGSYLLALLFQLIGFSIFQFSGLIKSSINEHVSE